MNEQKQYVCPWCGGKDVVEGIQSTYAKVQPNKALTLKGENFDSCNLQKLWYSSSFLCRKPSVLE